MIGGNFSVWSCREDLKLAAQNSFWCSALVDGDVGMRAADYGFEGFDQCADRKDVCGGTVKAKERFGLCAKMLSEYFFGLIRNEIASVAWGEPQIHRLYSCHDLGMNP